MKISDLIKLLEEVKEEHGDVVVFVDRLDVDWEMISVNDSETEKALNLV